MKYYWLLGVFISCQTPGLIQPETSSYFKDLIIREGSDMILGFGVLPQKNAYSFEFEARENPETIRISNCHRDLAVSNQKKRFRYDFVPTHLESGECPLHITFLDDKGRHQFGSVSFRDDEMIPAMVQCNGSIVKAIGASVCQAKTGTIQGIDFSVVVRGKTFTAGCAQPKSENGLAWRITAAAESCLYVFESEDGSFHKLTTFGYDDFISH